MAITERQRSELLSKNIEPLVMLIEKKLGNKPRAVVDLLEIVSKMPQESKTIDTSMGEEDKDLSIKV